MSDLPVASSRSDEIDLYTLAKALWQQKWIVVGVTALVAAAALVYAFSAKPVYEAKIYMLPPTQNGIADFNYGRTLGTDLPPFQVKDVYEVFARNLQSESLRQAFFEDTYLPSLDEETREGSRDHLYARFTKVLTVSAGGRDTPDRFTIAVQGGSSAVAAEWARAYVRRASADAKDEMIKNVIREAQVRARNLDQQVEGLRQTARAQREDRIKVLQEALAIAKAVGLKKPVIISNKDQAELATSIEGQTLYMRGSDALEAEIQVLAGRVSDDPFIDPLRALQVKHSFLSNLTIDGANVSVYRRDGEVEEPDAPIKPNKPLILLIGIVLGLMLGVIAAGIRHAQLMSRRRS